jgi:hypothetical protein
MAREKFFTIRLTDKEWERFEREAERRELPKAQVFREWLKTLEKGTDPVSKQ